MVVLSWSTNIEKIIEDFNGLDLCVFSSGTYDPKLEQEINVKQNKFVMETNFFGVLYCIKAVENYFKNNCDSIYQSSSYGSQQVAAAPIKILNSELRLSA
mgnify:CR=1 FL=1